MNQLMQSNVKTMSSLEIAKLVDSRHDKVKQSIERLASRNVISLPPFGVVVSQKNNREYETEVYLFSGEKGKRDSIVVVAQLSPEFTARLVDRWHELENHYTESAVQEIVLPKDYLSALKALVESEESKQIALQKLEIAAPKVDFYDRVADVGNLMTASVVGKKIGMSAQVLNNNLDSFKVYDKRQKGRVFSQWFIDQGLGEIKKTDNGFNSSKFTNKGEQWIVEKFVSEGII